MLGYMLGSVIGYMKGLLYDRINGRIAILMEGLWNGKAEKFSQKFFVLSWYQSPYGILLLLSEFFFFASYFLLLMEKSEISCIKFSGKNYFSWEFSFKFMFREKNYGVLLMERTVSLLIRQELHNG